MRSFLVGDDNKQPSKALWQLYELALQPPGYACRQGCSACCCTQSVTMTALEGELIIAYVPPAELAAALAAVDEEKLKRPVVTTNRYVRQFLGKSAQVEEVAGWSLVPCPFLRDKVCTIYPVRPFMCRGFVSRSDCRVSGCAEVPPQILLLNTIIQQMIEQLSLGRPWGLLSDILAPRPEVVLPLCEAMPGLYIDERERRQLGKYLARIGELGRKLFPSGDIFDSGDMRRQFKQYRYRDIEAAALVDGGRKLSLNLLMAFRV